MARRVSQTQNSEPEPEPDYTPPTTAAVNNSFPGMDPREAIFAHPDTWRPEDQERFAEEIREGLAQGWWDGLRRPGRPGRSDRSDRDRGRS